MPLTSKGSKILKAMKSQYGGKKGKSVFYASLNAGKIKGVEKRAEGGPVDPEGRRSKNFPEMSGGRGGGASGGQPVEVVKPESAPETTPVDRPQTLRDIFKSAGAVRKRARGGPVDPSSSQRLSFAPPPYEQSPPLQPAPVWGPKPGPMPKARGGPVSHGAYLVGEKGPELFVPQHKGAIVPNKEVRKLGAKYGKYVRKK